jgi:hypothetical protein
MKYIKFDREIFNIREFKKVKLNKGELNFVFDNSQYIFYYKEVLAKKIFDCFAEFLNDCHLFPIYKECTDVFDFEYVKICLDNDE